MRYSLWSDPWIDVSDLNGTMQRVSLETALTQAHELRDVIAQSPVSSAGSIRLLIAILQEMLRPETLADLTDLLRAGHFDPARITAFGAAYGHRFALFDHDAPFMQRPGDPADAPKAERKSPAALFIEVPSGSRRSWWTKVGHYEDTYIVCPACAAAGMLSFPPFATDFGGGVRASINGEGPLYIFPSGSTLFDGLARSILTPPFLPPDAEPFRNDTPWRWEPDAIGTEINGGLRKTIGYGESLCFPARTIQLIPQQRHIVCARCDRSSLLAVTEVVFQAGWYYRGPPWRDPFVAYFTTKKGTNLPVRARTHMAAWRDLVALIVAPLGSQRPLVIDQLAALVALDALPSSAMQAFRCIGLDVKKQASYFGWLDESLHLPAQLLGNAERAAQIAAAMERTTIVLRGVRGALQSTNALAGGPPAVDALLEDIWQALAPHFRDALINNTAQDFSLERWSDTLLALVRTMSADALAYGGASGRQLLRTSKGSQRVQQLYYGLKRKWNL